MGYVYAISNKGKYTCFVPSRDDVVIVAQTSLTGLSPVKLNKFFAIIDVESIESTSTTINFFPPYPITPNRIKNVSPISLVNVTFQLFSPNAYTAYQFGIETTTGSYFTGGSYVFIITYEL